MPETDNGGSVAVGYAASGTQPQAGERLQAGEAFADFYRRNHKEVLRHLAYGMATVHEAEDAVSEAMRDLMGRWGQVEYPLAYVKTAAMNYFIKARIRDRKRVEREDRRHDSTPEPDGQDALTCWENQEWVLQFLDSLPPVQRQVLALMVDEYSQTEIADLLGKTDAAVRQSVLAGRRALADRLEAARMSQIDRGPSSRDEA